MKTLLAEYCAAEFYTGWWAYLRDHNDGRPNDGWDSWGWLSGEHQRQMARDALVAVGMSPPPIGRHCQGFAEWLAAEHPNGVLVEAGGFGRIVVIGRWVNRPRQRRGHIRTIRGAAMAEAAKRRRAAA